MRVDPLGTNWQEVHARYLHTIGNLTLTGYNSELSDHPFVEKRDKQDGGFKDSPLRLNHGLGQLEQWNREAIEKRAVALAEKAAKIWSIPHLPTDLKPGQKVPLETVIGPIEHPLAGFVPAGFKIFQMTKWKYHLLREVEGEWVYYGNGKKASYAISWPNAGLWARDKEKRNKMPLGVGGVEGVEATYSAASLAEQDVLTDDNGGMITSGKKSYTLDDYPHLHRPMRELFESLRRRISNLDVTVWEDYKRDYIAYKMATNFVDVEIQMKRLLLHLNMPFHEINDPKGMCRDMTKIGHFGHGDIEFGISSLDQLDDAMNLVRQSFERHWEESEVGVV